MTQTSADDLIINQLQAIFQLFTSYLGQQCRIVFMLQLYLGERVEEDDASFELYFATSYSHLLVFRVSFCILRQEKLIAVLF